MTRSASYSIGTVAALTGLAPHTIRAWERRYGVVRPRRSSGGTRLYDDRDVTRLQLVKAITECGEPVRIAATLDDDGLRTRLRRLAGLATSASGAEPEPAGLRVGVLDPVLATQIESNRVALEGLDVEIVRPGDGLGAALRGRRFDVLVLALEQMGPDALRALETALAICGAKHAVVTYAFGRSALLARLSNSGARLVRAPFRLDTLRNTLRDLLVTSAARKRHALAALPRSGEGEDPPRRRFDDARLARLREVASAVECECPSHLAVLVSSLTAFEDYSRDCESRDEVDAALHARLARETGRARALVEDLLADVCRQDRIFV